MSSVTKPTPVAVLAPVQTPEQQRPYFAVYDFAKTLKGKPLKAGVYYHGMTHKDDKASEVDYWICAPLHIEAITSNSGRDFGLLLRFYDILGQWREWAMPMSMLKGTGEDLRGELLSMGLVINSNNRERNLLNQYLQSKRPDRNITSTQMTGWHNAELFILPHRVVGSGDAILQSELLGDNDYGQQGSLEGWKNSIGTYCQGNPLLLLGVCTSLAAPLMFHLNQQGGGFNIWTDSSSGKSTIAHAAASVWGHGERFIRTWNATGNGLEGIASQRNDTLLVLDELGEADAKDVGNIIYAIANGVGRSRAKRTGGAQASRRWRVMMLSTGEQTVSTKMAEAEAKQKAGQAIRLLDVSGQSQYGCFDNLHGFNHGSLLSNAIRNASISHYGWAGVEFISHLIKDSTHATLGAIFEQLKQDYPARNSQESRAGERFALLALAGELAQGFGILPIQEGYSRATMLNLYTQWQSTRSPEVSEDVSIRQSVNEFITRYAGACFSNIDESQSNVKDRAGWWKDTPNGRIWLFTGEGLKRSAPTYDLRRITKALDAKGWIAERDNQGRNSKIVRIDGRNERLYHVIPIT